MRCKRICPFSVQGGRCASLVSVFSLTLGVSPIQWQMSRRRASPWEHKNTRQTGYHRVHICTDERRAYNGTHIRTGPQALCCNNVLDRIGERTHSAPWTAAHLQPSPNLFPIPHFPDRIRTGVVFPSASARTRTDSLSQVQAAALISSLIPHHSRPVAQPVLT